MKNTIFPHKFWRPFWIACLSYFSPQYVSFLVHLYVAVIPNSSGQLAELNCLYYSARADLYSHQIQWSTSCAGISCNSKTIAVSLVPSLLAALIWWYCIHYDMQFVSCFPYSRQALISSKWDRCYFFTQAGNLMCQGRDEVGSYK